MSVTTSPPWLVKAWADFGVSAVFGQGTSPRVHAYYADAGHPEVAGDDVAWCAAFVGACLERSGIRSTKSLLARSYLAFGDAVETAQCGSVAIFSRADNPAQGHVAFVVGETTESVVVLGGNQSGSVTVMAMPRKRLLGLRWPNLAPAKTIDRAPKSNPPDDADTFIHALSHVLAMEGGYSDDPYDPGGPTNLGITVADLAAVHGRALTSETAAELKAKVVALTPADVSPIYRARYWEPSRAPALPSALALFHFDTAVNHGTSSAARMLQQALEVDVDGQIGPLTLAAAAATSHADVLNRYAEIRRVRYRSISTFWRFGHGWLARVDATLAAALARDGAAQVHPKETPMTSTPIPSATNAEPKWWGQSLTIWGTIVTGLATVMPIIGPLIGLQISADVVHQLGDGVIHVGQALAGVIGIVMTIYGRTRAVQPLVRRDFMVKL
jgi:uncharacterized protein (TIGR02594 family)